jgi:hypothetical protein
MTQAGSGRKDGGHSQGGEARPQQSALAANAMIILIDDCGFSPRLPVAQFRPEFIAVTPEYRLLRERGEFVPRERTKSITWFQRSDSAK